MMRPKLGPTAPPPMLDDETAGAILFPVRTATREAMKQAGLTKWLEAKKFHAERNLWMNDNGAR